MINIITGKPGTGKSYTLVLFAKKFLEQGDDVFANFKIDERRLSLRPRQLRLNWFLNLFRKKKLPTVRPLGRLYYWKDLTEFRNISQAIILMDEAQTYFSARRWKDMTAEDEVKFQQHRKQGIDIYAGVQNLNRCDKIIRELAAYAYEVRRVGNVFLRKRYTPEELDKAKRSSDDTTLYLLDKKLASAYNSHEFINVRFEELAKVNFKQMRDFFG